MFRAGPVSSMSDNSPPSLSPSSTTTESSHGPVSDANIRNFAPVARIMKTALPENAKIAKEAKECMQECVSEFISFITSEGSQLGPLLSSSFAHTNAFIFDPYSFREMPAGEAQDSQW